MSALNHTLGFLKDDSGYLHVVLGWRIERGGNDLGVDGAGHVGHLLWTLIDEEHHEVSLGMVGSDGVGDVLHEQGFTSLRLCHDEGALSLSDGREEIDHT